MIKCPVCGKFEFESEGDYDGCEFCNWQNDGLQMNHPDYAGGANWLSLNQARSNYEKYGVIMTDKDKQERKDFYIKMNEEIKQRQSKLRGVTHD